MILTKKSRFWFSLISALATGLLIGWVDTRPTWDDTGITVAAIMIAACLFSLLTARYAWLWALAIGSGVAGLNIVMNGGYAALVALPAALFASYLGVLIRKATNSFMKSDHLYHDN